MQGLNQDHPLLLSSILEHGATTHGDVAIIGRYTNETIDTTYAQLDKRARQLGAALQTLGYGPDRFIGSLAWNTTATWNCYTPLLGSALPCTPLTRACRRPRSPTRSTSPDTRPCLSTATRWPSPSNSRRI